MDWRVIFTTFALIFVAELGDKTQLAVFAQASRTRAPLAVFLGASAALAASSLLGVLLGGILARLPDKANLAIKAVAGVLFIGFGVWTFIEIYKQMR